MIATNFETVNTRIDKGICTIELNRPECLNAMNRRLIDETAEAFAGANRDDDVNVIVFTGKGRAFCAGDDRNQHVHPDNRSQARDLVEAIQQVTREMVFGEKPVVGAINGWAVGGGFEWAINCDFPIWGRSARAFFPEMSLNLFVTGGVTALLPALAGLNRAREMLMLGQKYSADELFEMNVAWRVVDDHLLLDEAQQVAETLSELPPLSLRAMKRVLNLTATSSLETALQLETEATVDGFMDPETSRRLLDF